MGPEIDSWWEYQPFWRAPTLERHSEVRPIYSPSLMQPIRWWKLGAFITAIAGVIGVLGFMFLVVARTPADQEALATFIGIMLGLAFVLEAPYH